MWRRTMRWPHIRSDRMKRVHTNDIRRLRQGHGTQVSTSIAHGDKTSHSFEQADLCRGGPLRYRNSLARVWHPMLKELGLPVGGVHLLRHSATARIS